MKTFAQSLKDAMTSAEIKAKQLAEQSGVAQPTIYNLLKGKQCSLENFVKLGKIVPALADDLGQLSF